MSLDTAERSTEFAYLVADNDNDGIVINNDSDGIVITEGGLSIQARRAFARMIDHCDSQAMGAKYLARGVVIDTMDDIARQIHENFPHTINVEPAVDYLNTKLIDAARGSGQRFQEVMLAYVDNGIPPKPESMNKHTQLTCITPDSISEKGGVGGFTKTYKAPWGGGAGDGSDLNSIVTMGVKKFFVLSIAALNIEDARASELMADMNMVHAFGTQPAVMNAVAETKMGGGEPAKMMDSAIEQVAEIKTLKAALIDAGTTPQADAIATALAHKTETLSAALPTMVDDLPPAVTQQIAQNIDDVKLDMGTRQMAQAIELIADAKLPTDHRTTLDVRNAVEVVQQIAASRDLSVAEMITLVMAKDAPQSLTQPVRELTAQLSRTETLPAIERHVPMQVVADTIRTSLIEAPLQVVASIPVAPAVVIETLASIGQKFSQPTLTQAARFIETSLPANTFAATPAAVPPAQALGVVVENLQAMRISTHTPPAVKAELATILPIIETMQVQARAAAPNFVHTAIQTLSEVFARVPQAAAIESAVVKAAPAEIAEKTVAGKIQDNVIKTEKAPVATTEKAQENATKADKAETAKAEKAPAEKVVAEAGKETNQSDAAKKAPATLAARAADLKQDAISNLTQLAQTSDHATINAAVAALADASSNKNMRIVIENLMGLLHSVHVPQELKAQIAGALTKLKAAQKAEEDAANTGKLQKVSPYAPLAQLAEAVDLPKPKVMSPSPWTMREDGPVQAMKFGSATETLIAANNNAASKNAGQQEVTTAASAETRARQSRGGGRCGGCSAAFCGACNAATEAAVSKMDSSIDVGALRNTLKLSA